MNEFVTVLAKTETAVIEIQGSWNKTVQSMLDTAKLITDYERREDWFDIKSELSLRGIMQDSVISMMLSIGGNSLLQSDKNVEFLPRSYNTLYNLSLLDDKELIQRFQSGDINPSLRLIDARKFHPQKTNKPSSSKPNTTKNIVNISTNLDDYKNHKKEIDKFVQDISKKYPYLIVKVEK